MSKLNINRNIFLEKEELVRFQDFLLNNTASQVLLENTSKWGIVRTVFEGTSPDFLVEVGSNLGTIKIATQSKAVDKNLMLIKQPAIDNVAVPADGSFYWVKISHKYETLEEGFCSINASGYVTGVNTKFSEVLRGQNTEVPVKIKFYKSSGLVNDQVYEVVNMVPGALNTEMLLSGVGFVAESDLKYRVIGSTPLGEVVTSEQLTGLYQYDSCNIELIAESTLGVAPVIDYVADEQFYIARVVNNAGTVTVEDKRENQYLTFNVEGTNDKLTKDQNLADLTDPAAARANLGVLSSTESATLFVDSGWKTMIKGVAALATDFDIKVRRYGKVCVVQGTFSNGSNSSANTIIASIPYSELYLPSETILGTSEKIWFLCGPQIGNNDDNYGIFGYINQTSISQTMLELKVDQNYGGSFGSKFNINFSFFLD